MSATVAALPKVWSRVLREYYRGPDHPFKIRFWDWLRRTQAYRPLTVGYGSSGWLIVDERCFIQREVLVKGEYEPEVTTAILALASGGDVVWDIGANIGIFAVSIRYDARVARVVCFEPDPANRDALGLNLRLNGGAAYEVRSVAVSDVSEERMLWPGPTVNRGMSSLAGPPVGSGETGWSVRCETIDALVFEQGVPAPTLIKMDIEGWEYPALLGGLRLLRERPPKAIVFESTCDADGEIADTRITALLSAHGFAVEKIRRPYASVNSQENFVARLAK